MSDRARSGADRDPPEDSGRLALRPAAGEKTRRGRTFHPLIELVLSRIREFVREPEAVFWVFIFPVLLALALGIAFRGQPTPKLRVALDDRVSGAPRMLAFFRERADLDPVLLSRAEALERLRTGKVELVVAPAGEGGDGTAMKPAAAGTASFRASSDAASEGAPPALVTYLYDPTRPESRLARLAADEALQRGMGRKDAAGVSESIVTEPGSRYIDYLIPGLIGLNLMASGMWGIGFNVVESRTRKLLKLLTATPMRRSHYLLSFMLSRLLFLILEVVALVGFGWLVFDVEVRGSILGLALILLAGAMTFAGLGMLVAARSRSIEAVSGWMNFVMLPMWLLSGSFFSYSRFPEIMHPLIRLLPLTALNDALRAVMNDGRSLAATGWELAVLAGWGVVCFALALRIFRWQ
ncbi:MAG: ABC transporter permease [bacterium]